jgi:RimJ/RimL family protein N-acetyltransferase
MRPLRRSDIDAVCEACQDPDTQRYTTVPVPYTREDAVRFVEEQAPVASASGRMSTFAISAAADGSTFDGSIDLRFGDSANADVGYAIAPWARRQGIGSDALRTICRWGFTEHAIERIGWEAVVGNCASRRTAEKVGFQFEGTCRQLTVLRGVRHDAWIAGLLPADLTS